MTKGPSRLGTALFIYALQPTEDCHIVRAMSARERNSGHSLMQHAFVP